MITALLLAAALSVSDAAYFAALPLRTGNWCGPTGASACTVHYFCECNAGSEAGCTAGNDANSGLTPSLAKRSFEAARTTFNSMAAGDTVAMCKGGSWVVAGAAADLIQNYGCARTAAGSVINATVDGDYRTVPTGTVAPGTVCTWREYQASWGGTNKPHIVKTGGSIFRTTNDPDQGGYQWLNLDLDGTGGGSDAFDLYGWYHDITLGGNTIRNWPSTCIVLNSGGMGTATAPNSSLRWNVSIQGNTIQDCSMGVYAEAGDNFDLSYNTFLRAGSGTGYNHAYYITSMQTKPTGGSHYLPYFDIKVRGNTHSGAYGGGTCLESQAKMAGNSRNAIVEDNTFDYASGASSTCWLWGTNSSNDNDKAGFQGMMVRRNRFIGGGNTQAEIAGCANCTFENNIFTTEFAGAVDILRFVQTRSASHRTAEYGGTCNPAVPYGTTACDDQNTGLQLRNNTFYRASTSTGSNPLRITQTGTGHVVANNASWFGGTTGNSCYSVQSPATSTFVGNNYCRNGSGATAVSVFVNAPTDFTPQAGSPLINAGNATYAPATDFYGTARASPPEIGAIEIPSLTIIADPPIMIDGQLFIRLHGTKPPGSSVGIFKR